MTNNNNLSANESATTLPSLFVIQLTLTASLGGCLFGYDMGAISGTLPQLSKTFDLNDAQKESIVSVLYVGGTVGAAFGGYLCDKIGRKTTIILTDIVFILGALWLYSAHNYHSVVFGRFFVGIGVAVSGIADVSYLQECSPIKWRGSIVSVNEACISLGFLLAYLAGFVLSDSEAEDWRKIFGLAGVIAVIQMIGMLLLPESPKWLALIGKLEAARKVSDRINNLDPSIDKVCRLSEDSSIMSIRRRNRQHLKHDIDCLDTVENNVVNNSGTYNYNTDLAAAAINGSNKNEIAYSLDRESSFPMESSTTRNTSLRSISVRQNIQKFFQTLSQYRRQIYIALYLAVVQQFCGQTNILNYAPLIFSEASDKDNDGEVSEDTPDWSMVIVGLVKFAVTVLVIWRIEYIGRRVLLIFGNLLIASGLMALIIAFGGSSNYSDDDQNSWSPLTNMKTFHLALPGVLLVVCGYSISFGPLTWLLTSEIFPTDIRGRALGGSTIISYFCGAIATQTFLGTQSSFGPSFVFGIYCIITLFGVLFAYMAIPDTGEKSVEQINESLNRMQWWRYGSIVVPQNDLVPSFEMSENSSQVPEFDHSIL